MWDEQGSGGSVQSQGAQAVPGGQAGQLHTAGGVVAGAGAVAVPLPVLPAWVAIAGTVIVEVEAEPQVQLQGAQSAPDGQAGQAQVHVPLPVVPLPQVVPPEPPEPPPVPELQPQAQGGQTWPGAQAGQAQVQVPPPPPGDPPVPDGGGGGQSQATGGQAPSFGQASGCTQPQPPFSAVSSQQYPPCEQSWPTGQSAGVVPEPSMAVQAQRASIADGPVQDSGVFRLAHGSIAAHTPAGQSALGGHWTAVQAQATLDGPAAVKPALVPLHASAVVIVAQGSATMAAASCSCGWLGGGVSDDDPQADSNDAASKK